MWRMADVPSHVPNIRFRGNGDMPLLAAKTVPE